MQRALSFALVSVIALVLAVVAGLSFYRAYERSHADCGPGCVVVYTEGVYSVRAYLVIGGIAAFLALMSAVLAVRSR